MNSALLHPSKLKFKSFAHRTIPVSERRVTGRGAEFKYRRSGLPTASSISDKHSSIAGGSALSEVSTESLIMKGPLFD
jgi:hypothetical protein